MGSQSRTWLSDFPLWGKSRNKVISQGTLERLLCFDCPLPQILQARLWNGLYQSTRLILEVLMRHWLPTTASFMLSPPLTQQSRPPGRWLCKGSERSPLLVEEGVPSHWFLGQGSLHHTRPRCSLSAQTQSLYHSLSLKTNYSVSFSKIKKCIDLERLTIKKAL